MLPPASYIPCAHPHRLLMVRPCQPLTRLSVLAPMSNVRRPHAPVHVVVSIVPYVCFHPHCLPTGSFSHPCPVWLTNLPFCCTCAGDASRMRRTSSPASVCISNRAVQMCRFRWETSTVLSNDYRAVPHHMQGRVPSTRAGLPPRE